MPLMRQLINVPSAYDLIKCTDNIEFKSIVDVGFGFGGASIYYARKEKEVTSIGLHIEATNYPKIIFKDLNIQTIETSFEDFESSTKFDAILMCHVLEHTQNPGFFLKKAKQLLAENGWLFVMVPPFKHEVVRGHVSTGWNLGILMYNLLLSGFNIKDGHFITYDYNVCAFVQNSTINTEGILQNHKISIKDTKEMWPISVDHGFCGEIQEINWFSNFLDKEGSFEDYLLMVNENEFQYFLNNYKNKKIYFYGADYLAKALINSYDLSTLNIMGFLDKDDSKSGLCIGDYEIFSLDMLESLNPEVIVLTVDRADAILPYVQDLLITNNIDCEIVSNLFNNGNIMYKFMNF